LLSGPKRFGSREIQLNELILDSNISIDEFQKSHAKDIEQETWVCLANICDCEIFVVKSLNSSKKVIDMI